MENQERPKEAMVSYQSHAGDAITLSSGIVKAYLVSGNRDLVSSAEVNMFLRLCQYQRLNPFLKEAYLIKYDSKTPASMVVGKEAFMKRAEKHEDYNGQEAGIVVVTADGKVETRIGTLYIKDSETLVGGWAKVYRKNYARPIEMTVSLSEYNTGMSKWKSAPATMIRKVALMQALREAFPTALGALYEREEQGVEGDNPIGDIVIEPPQEVPTVDQETGEVIDGAESGDLPWDKPE